MGIRALIDGDVIVYVAGFAAEKVIRSIEFNGEYREFASASEMKRWVENYPDKEPFNYEQRVEVEPVENALSNAKNLLNEILEVCQTTEYKVFLTGKNNFREEMYPEYKANRPDRKPTHYDAVKEYLINYWDAEVVDGQEADDAMSIWQYSANNWEPKSTIICTKDKDLDMVPGLHYNFSPTRKDNGVYEVSEIEGKRSFYKQLITGDSTDNIPGLYKLEKKRATKERLRYIDNLDNDWDMWDYVLGLYSNTEKDDLITIARLLWMREYDGQMWEPPREESEEESSEEVYGEFLSPQDS